MIGNFARMVRGPFRALPPGMEMEIAGEPPEAFVEKVSEDGGDVYVAPLVEHLMALLRRNREPSTAAPEDGKADDPRGNTP